MQAKVGARPTAAAVKDMPPVSLGWPTLGDAAVPHKKKSAPPPTPELLPAATASEVCKALEPYLYGMILPGLQSHCEKRGALVSCWGGI